MDFFLYKSRLFSNPGNFSTGSEKIRPYWKHYFAGAEGVVFVVDSASSEHFLDVAARELRNAMLDANLTEQPCLILLNCQDKENSWTQEQVSYRL